MIHDEPDGALPLPVLARAAGLSSSAVAKRFHDLVGTSPARYPKNWRMQRAAEDLGRTDRSIQTISEAVGVRSDKGVLSCIQARDRHDADRVARPPGPVRRRGPKQRAGRHSA